MKEYIERDKVLFDIEEAMKYRGLGFVFGSELKRYIKRQPAADVVEVAPELREAVTMLHKEYENAKQNPIVRDPLAYALYQVWKSVDGRRNGR